MRIADKHYRSLWWDEQLSALQIIDQRALPHELREQSVLNMQDYIDAIAQMRVRGAPLIGATAAYGMAYAMSVDATDNGIEQAWNTLYATRPTAVNLRWALDRCKALMLETDITQRAATALSFAHQIADQDVETNRLIGVHGLPLIKTIAQQKTPGEPVQVLTHCNAGWLATVDWGTATSPMFQAHDAGISLHVWVDETRPRNQGALTAWELGNHGVPHTYITDNAGGHLMQHGHVDMVLVGSDRTTRSGDVCNKIGTYLKALAAHDNVVPFYVALPSSTIDWNIADGVRGVPIEERSPRETSHVQGLDGNGETASVQVTPQDTPVGNPAFDVTPSRLVTGLITERGVCEASPEGLAKLFPDLA